MEKNKKIIKAESLKPQPLKVEKVNLTQRRFKDRVFKNVQLNGTTLEFGEQFDPEAPAGQAPIGLEKHYDDAGVLTGVRITCRCGEVIELEFTQD